ncbi:hypothetical protein G3545_02620 [Starkeya sp. ORNL1]|uniref:hypothetical protein n=1 Tax=Starkeya sp. ORNL1 TaxID=2709380 RepID=UPI00146470F2|nr:hypothetical protein [Starkeya sp. ORNL1]QJP12651.1 hypothetical protein G3545_02620 [Starkeya sp. ORNL1]
MRKIVLAAATLGILSIGGIINANAQYYQVDPYARGEVYAQPGVTVVEPGYAGPVYEGRNVYVEPGPGPIYDHEATVPSQKTARDLLIWKQPGDQNIINQERANERAK